MIRSNFRNIWFGWVSSFIVLFSFQAGAQDFENRMVCDEEDPGLCSVDLQIGEGAPFAGQLVTPKLGISLGMKIERLEEKLKLDVARLKDLHKIEIEAQKKVAKIDSEAKEKQLVVMEEALEDSTQSDWYQHPAFVASVTVVITSLIFFGAIYAINSVGEDI